MEHRPRVHGLVRLFAILGVSALVLGTLSSLLPLSSPTIGPAGRTEVLLENVFEACLQHARERGTFPPADEDGGTRALVAALTRPSGAGGGGVPFLGVTPRDLDGAALSQVVDAWGRPLRYRLQGRGGELRSAGSDGTFGTSDDLVLTK